MRRKEKHDAWMNDLFWRRNSNLSHAHMSSVLCDLCNDCTCEDMACGRCICLQSTSLPGAFLSFQPRDDLPVIRQNQTFPLLFPGRCSQRGCGHAEVQLSSHCSHSFLSLRVPSVVCLQLRPPPVMRGFFSKNGTLVA